MKRRLFIKSCVGLFLAPLVAIPVHPDWMVKNIKRAKQDIQGNRNRILSGGSRSGKTCPIMAELAQQWMAEIRKCETEFFPKEITDENYLGYLPVQTGN